MSKHAMDLLRQTYTNKIAEFLRQEGEEVLLVGTNEIAIPCIDVEGNEQFCCFIVKIPVGSRDGDTYDGYSMAEEYSMKQAEKEAKAKEAAARKAAKIARDQKMREQKAAAKAAHEAKAE